MAEWPPPRRWEQPFAKKFLLSVPLYSREPWAEEPERKYEYRFDNRHTHIELLDWAIANRADPHEVWAVAVQCGMVEGK